MSLLALLAAIVPASVTINAASPGVAVRAGTLQGLPLCVWNDSSLFTTLRAGMRERADRVFRFPNGSYSDIYHWNGTGAYSADSVWVADDTKYTPGWASTSIHRGLTNGSDLSLIDDGDTSTFWWSNGDHPSAPGWLMMDLGAAKSLDSFALWLGVVRSDSVQIIQWTGANAIYPPPMQQMDGAKWIEVARLKSADFVSFKLATAVSARFIGVRPIGVLANGWQAREFKVLKGETSVSVNVASASQTQVYTASAHPASRSKNFVPNWDFDTYMTWIRNYPDAIPMICVNYGTGTPEEAAAWIHYANKVKNYGIKRWQVGNESSGQWEESGCVTARQYAERFVKFAKAMRAEDSTIEIEGPVLAGTEFVTQASGDFDGRTWMEGFLRYVDSAEKALGTRLVDGIDFHNYPYWFNASPDVDEMFAACDKNGSQYDSLIALMGRSMANPGSRQILMTEFNTSTATSSLEMEASAGSAFALQFAHFIQRFGDRGLTNTWELYTGILKGSDESHGSLSVFVKPTKGEWSSLNYPPNASFWASRTIMRQWLDTAGGDTIMPIDQVAGARLFAVRNNGRVSVLAINMSADSLALNLDPALFPNGGDVLSWGTGEYLWNGTDADARAIPNNGPSSKTISGSWNGSAKIPPYGMLVVRAAGRGKQPLRTAHWLVGSRNLTINDTLVVSGWTTSEGAKLASGTWSMGDAHGNLTATDGAWDGPSESWTVTIPAVDLGVGDYTLKIALADDQNEIAVDSVGVGVSGTIRPVNLVADFETQKATTVTGLVFYPYAADNTKATVRIVPHAGSTGYCMKDSLVLTQPADLNYTNFGTSFSGITNAHQLDSAFGLVGVAFDISTKHSLRTGTFSMAVKLSTVKDYDDYSISVPNTKGAWIRDTVMFADMAQGGWGDAVPFNVDSISGMGFSANGAGTIVMQIDNIYFLGTKGQAIDVGVRRSAKGQILSLSGRKLSITESGNWTLRLVGPNGRVNKRLTGIGATLLSLGTTAGPQWAILEAEGKRKILALPVVR
jgi:hypothetical protein